MHAHPPVTARADVRRVRAVVIAAIVFVLAVAIRWAYVDRYAVAVPFWDQWDAEGDDLIRPWLEGTLSWQGWWDAHNEHRILPTKLLTLLSFELFGEWSNLHEARLSALVGASIPALFAWLMLRERSMRPAAAAALGVVLLGVALPFAWENFLVGFQSQFYFLVLFGVTGVALAALKPTSRSAAVAAIACAAAAAMTMASGLLTAPAIAFVYLLQWYLQKLDGRRCALVVAALLVVALLAFQTMPVIAGHAGMKAQNPIELLDAASHVLGWPIPGYHWAPLPLWLPVLLALAIVVRTRKATAIDVVMLGCAAWTAAQALAIAYGRGHGLIDVAGRYTEVLLVGLGANAWFSVRLFQWAAPNRARQAAMALVGAAFFVPLLGSLAMRYPADLQGLRDRHRAALVQSENVRSYLETGDPGALDRPFFEIPYPSAERLRSLLDNPAIRSALPRELKAPASVPEQVPSPG